MKLSSPWVNYCHEVEALFAEDSEIKVVYDDENVELKLYVDNVRKADALAQLMPEEKVFGNVTMKISVIPANRDSISDIFYEAFSGNPVLSFVWEADTPMGKMDYVVFKNQVVQYFNDDISDVHGNRSTLFQDIAKDVFKDDMKVFFCTDAGDKKLAKPLGEWP